LILYILSFKKRLQSLENEVFFCCRKESDNKKWKQLLGKVERKLGKENKKMQDF